MNTRKLAEELNGCCVSLSISNGPVFDIDAAIEIIDRERPASHGQEERALYLLGELMSYDNFQLYPSSLRERVGTFMARIENGTVPD